MARPSLLLTTLTTLGSTLALTLAAPGFAQEDGDATADESESDDDKGGVKGGGEATPEPPADIEPPREIEVPDEAPDKKCRRKQRLLTPGTPVLGGPGLGFEIIQVIEATTCKKILQATEDGSFALVQLDKDRVGWVATGLVDERLSETLPEGDVQPLEGTAVAQRDAALRTEPRFDAPAKATPVKAGTELTLKGISPDGQWRLVAIGPVEGWLPKYQVGEALPDAAAAPTAGAGGWASTRIGRKPAGKMSEFTSKEELAAAPEAPQEGEAKEGEAKEGEAKEGEAKEGEAKEGETKEGEAKEGEAEPLPVGPVLGRTQEVTVGFGYSYWYQGYRSDSQGDPFHKYDLHAPIGGDFMAGYAYRGSFPLVVDVRFGSSFTSYPFAAGPAPEQQVNVLAGRFSPEMRLGWRLFDGINVDVEAGAMVSSDVVWNYGLQADVPAVVNGFYGQAGPVLTARSRLGGGTFGLLVLEVGVPVGAYAMFPDPYNTYATKRDAGEIDPINKDARPVDLANPDANADPADAELDPPLFVHFAVGAQGRARYEYAITDLFHLHMYMGLRARQAQISGPGYRTGAYAQANQVDLHWATGAGMTFGF